MTIIIIFIDQEKIKGDEGLLEVTLPKCLNLQDGGTVILVNDRDYLENEDLNDILRERNKEKALLIQHKSNYENFGAQNEWLRGLKLNPQLVEEFSHSEGDEIWQKIKKLMQAIVNNNGAEIIAKWIFELCIKKSNFNVLDTEVAYRFLSEINDMDYITHYHKNGAFLAELYKGNKNTWTTFKGRANRKALEVLGLPPHKSG